MSSHGVRNFLLKCQGLVKCQGQLPIEHLRKHKSTMPWIEHFQEKAPNTTI
jgi:hypothetical protein